MRPGAGAASSRCSRRWRDATRKARQAALGETEDVALAAQLEVLLGEVEAVGQLDDGGEPLPADRPLGDVRDEHAERLGGAASDPAAELVQLGKAEPIGALDDHDRRFGDVDADLDDGRSDQDVELAVPEARHLGVPVGAP